MSSFVLWAIIAFGFSSSFSLTFSINSFTYSVPRKRRSGNSGLAIANLSKRVRTIYLVYSFNFLEPSSRSDIFKISSLPLKVTKILSFDFKKISCTSIPFSVSFIGLSRYFLHTSLMAAGWGGTSYNFSIFLWANSLQMSFLTWYMVMLDFKTILNDFW